MKKRSLKRRGGSALVAAVLIGASLVAAAPSSSADVGTDAVTDQASPETLHALDVREMLGLPTDAGTLQQAKTSSLVRSSIPVTTLEALDLDRRADMGKWAINSAPLLDVAGTFGGSFTDPKTGVLHLGFTKAPPSSVLALIAGESVKGPLQVDAVQFSQAQLEKMQDLLWANQPALSRLGLTIESSFVDVTANRIDIAFNGDGDLAGAVHSVLGAAAEGVNARQATGGDEQSRSRTTGRAFGGLWTLVPAGSCTIGFSALRSNASSLTYYSVTAGHCVRVGDTTYFGLSTSVPLGQVTATKYPGSGATSNCDCAVVSLNSTSRLSSDVLVNNDAVFDYTRTGNLGDFSVGNSVCNSGAATYDATGTIKCGTLRSGAGRLNVAGGGSLYDMAVVTGTGLTRDGDSGGPWGRNEAWMGVHHGIYSGNTYFSKALYIPAAFGVTAVYNGGF